MAVEHPTTPLGASPEAPVWTVAPAVAWTHSDDDSAVVMAMAAGQPLQLSPTGSLVWEVLVHGRTPDEDLLNPPPAPLALDDLVAEVAAAVGESPETVRDDVAAFLRMLEAHGVAVCEMEPHPHSRLAPSHHALPSEQ